LSPIEARHRSPRKSYLSVIRGTRSEEGLEGVVTGKKETGEVDEELASDVEEHEEEVDSDKTQDGVDLGNGGLTLKVVKDGVLGELSHGNVSQDRAQKRGEIAGDRVRTTASKRRGSCCSHKLRARKQCSPILVRGLELARHQRNTQSRETYLLVELGYGVLGTVLERGHFVRWT
jgi:hypothetical protein